MKSPLLLVIIIGMVFPSCTSPLLISQHDPSSLPVSPFEAGPSREPMTYKVSDPLAYYHFLKGYMAEMNNDKQKAFQAFLKYPKALS